MQLGLTLSLSAARVASAPPSVVYATDGMTADFSETSTGSYSNLLSAGDKASFRVDITVTDYTSMTGVLLEIGASNGLGITAVNGTLTAFGGYGTSSIGLPAHTLTGNGDYVIEASWDKNTGTADSNVALYVNGTLVDSVLGTSNSGALFGGNNIGVGQVGDSIHNDNTSTANLSNATITLAEIYNDEATADVE